MADPGSSTIMQLRGRPTMAGYCERLPKEVYFDEVAK
jgi:hypothetical protein